MSEANDKRFGRGRKFLISFASALWAAVLLSGINLVIISSNPDSAWAYAFDGIPQYLAQEAVPQGWGFFTRDAEEPQLFLYAAQDGGWNRIDTSHGSLRWTLGADRSGRSFNLLLHEMSVASGLEWQHCDGMSDEGCLSAVVQQPTKVIVDDGVGLISSCHVYGLVKKRPIPWEWMQLGEKANQPKEVVQVRMNC